MSFYFSLERVLPTLFPENMAVRNYGIVPNIMTTGRGTFYYIWSFTNFEHHLLTVANFKVGDLVDVEQRRKLDDTSSMGQLKYEITKDNVVQMLNVPVAIRRINGRLRGYSTLCGEIVVVDPSYEKVVDKTVFTAITWDYHRAKWSIVGTHSEPIELTEHGKAQMELLMPCQGIAFCKENDRLIVWAKGHEIIELDPDDAINEGHDPAKVGSFLQIRVAPTCNKTYSTVREYSVIQSCFNSLIVSKTDQEVLLIKTFVQFDGSHDDFNGRFVSYASHPAFRKVYNFRGLQMTQMGIYNVILQLSNYPVLSWVFELIEVVETP